jgi:hypothetical protein
MMSDNKWDPEAVMDKVISIADSPGVTDRAKWKDQAQVGNKPEPEA